MSNQAATHRSPCSVSLLEMPVLQLSAMTEERDGLQEDLRGHRDSKRSVESSFRAERERATKMENDLKFYQEQSARAISDRDQVRV